MPAAKAPFIRFHDYIRARHDSGCWEWTGHRSSVGYGCLKVFGSMKDAHRFAYELYKGPIPDGLHVLHSCDNKLCVNPSHLSLGTHADNMRQAAERGRMRSGARHPMFGVPSPRRGIGSKQSTPVLVLGKAYGSQNEAEKALGLGSGTVRYWTKTGNAKARLISTEEYHRYVEQGIAYRSGRQGS